MKSSIPSKHWNDKTPVSEAFPSGTPTPSSTRHRDHSSQLQRNIVIPQVIVAVKAVIASKRCKNCRRSALAADPRQMRDLMSALLSKRRNTRGCARLFGESDGRAVVQLPRGWNGKGYERVGLTARSASQQIPDPHPISADASGSCREGFP